jgi:hypothetical protein
MNTGITFRLSVSVLLGLVGVAFFVAVFSHCFSKGKSPQGIQLNASPFQSVGASAKDAISITSGSPAISLRSADWGSTNHFGLPTSEDNASVMIEDEIQSQFNANAQTFSSVIDELASRPAWSSHEQGFERTTRQVLPASAIATQK